MSKAKQVALYLRYGSARTARPRLPASRARQGRRPSRLGDRPDLRGRWRLRSQGSEPAPSIEPDAQGCGERPFPGSPWSGSSTGWAGASCTSPARWRNWMLPRGALLRSAGDRQHDPVRQGDDADGVRVRRTGTKYDPSTCHGWLESRAPAGSEKARMASDRPEDRRGDPPSTWHRSCHPQGGGNGGLRQRQGAAREQGDGAGAYRP
jgi:hypothetical protein